MTFVYYPDIQAKSALGKYRIEITGVSDKSPFFRDQSDFTYALFEASSNRLLWQWKPPKENDFADHPHEAWVNDDGWVVVRLHTSFHAGILVLSPQGELRMLRTLRNDGQGDAGLMAGESDEHIGHTSAGPNWEWSSIAVFIEYDGKSFWSIRTWWGRRLVIDLESGCPVETLTDDFQADIKELEKEWLLNTLARANKLTEPDDRWSKMASNCYSAAYHAGILEIQEAQPLLHSLETCAVTGGSSSRYGLSYQRLPLRLVAKMSLLRLGVEPRWFSNFIFTDDDKKQCEYPESCVVRSPDMIRAGMSQRELLRELGTPEFIDGGWGYSFFQDGKNFEMRVHWYDRHYDSYAARDFDFEQYRKLIRDDPPVVERAERIDLPSWKIDGLREYSIAHAF